MKTTSFILALTLAGVTAAVAGDSDKKQEKQDQQAAKTSAPVVEKAKKESDGKKTHITGSYIKQDIHRSGLITDGTSQVLVVDLATIENSGAPDVRQVLVRKGIR